MTVVAVTQMLEESQRYLENLAKCERALRHGNQQIDPGRVAYAQQQYEQGSAQLRQMLIRHPAANDEAVPA